METTYIYDSTEYPINFKAPIGLVGMGALVTQIVNNIVDEDGYYPYYYESALYGNILSAYSDFEAKGIVELDAVLVGSDIKTIVEQCIIGREFKLITDSVDKMIEFKKQQLASKSEFDGLISDVRKIIANLNENYVKPLKPKTFEKLINNLSKMKLDEKSLVNALIDAKVIDKKFHEAEAKSSKIINITKQQRFDGEEIRADEVE